MIDVQRYTSKAGRAWLTATWKRTFRNDGNFKDIPNASSVYITSRNCTSKDISSTQPEWTHPSLEGIKPVIQDVLYLLGPRYFLTLYTESTLLSQAVRATACYSHVHTILRSDWAIYKTLLYLDKSLSKVIKTTNVLPQRRFLPSEVRKRSLKIMYVPVTARWEDRD